MANRVTKNRHLKIKHNLYIPPHLRGPSWNTSSECVNDEFEPKEEKLCNNSHLLFETYSEKEVQSDNEFSEKENEEEYLNNTTRPIACYTVIKRLVSGALGLKASISNEERKVEEILKRIKDKKKHKAYL